MFIHICSQARCKTVLIPSNILGYTEQGIKTHFLEYQNDGSSYMLEDESQNHISMP